MKTKFKSFGNIHTVLGILATMLLVQTASAQTWFTNEVWISTTVQTNATPYLNVYGNGTLDCPYDGSTQLRFDAVMASPLIFSNTTIHLLAGNYQTYGTGAWFIQTGWKVLGSGIDNTIVKLIPNNGNGSYVLVMGVSGNNNYSNIVVADLTLDASSASANTIAYDGINLAGSYNTVRNVKVINTGGSSSTTSFGIELGYCSGMGVNNSEGNLVENCELGPVIASDGLGITFGGGANNWASGIVRNNHIIFTPTPSGHQSTAVSGAWMRNTLIDGNYINGAVAGFYGNGNGGSFTNIVVAHNVFENVQAPVFFSGGPMQNLAVCYNTISSTASNGVAWGFRFDSSSTYTNIAIIGNTITFNGNHPIPGSQFLWVNNITGLIVANNTVDPGLGNSLSGCTGVSIYNNYDLSGNFLTNLNQVALPNGDTRRTVTYSGSGIYTNYAGYADEYIGVKGITSGNSGRVTIVLPSAVGYAGKEFVVADESGQLSSSSGPRYIRILTTSPNLINGLLSITNSTPYTASTVIADGTNWFVR